MANYRIRSRQPIVHPSAYVSEHAVIIGDVELEEGVSVWPGAVIRGDNEKIVIRRDVNVQDGAIIHADPGFPVTIGQGVSIGHQAMLHGCTIGENCLIGIQAVILNGARVGRNCLVGAGALLSEGKSFPERSLIIGTPARVSRELTDDVIAQLSANARDYRERGQSYRTELERVD
ncbi:gamma carbonic anhydrase family protein [Burkholderia sp. SG-MS1]|uniref:gamma carbonic anhydrase family protein n=1 Tax=Paraburkholderia sp. SG-MS1 TaxID=2023741 RepID=UPI001445C810|nr:gamma carbonic anhydrase family protein [Paraburkholderia sp. SG-MS1]NKJ50687.1 gamma carbonic anhydrase family protein [Paraburkholderia sp. SG-MS1]